MFHNKLNDTGLEAEECNWKCSPIFGYFMTLNSSKCSSNKHRSGSIPIYETRYICAKSVFCANLARDLALIPRKEMVCAGLALSLVLIPCKRWSARIRRWIWHTNLAQGDGLHGLGFMFFFAHEEPHFINSILPTPTLHPLFIDTLFWRTSSPHLKSLE